MYQRWISVGTSSDGSADTCSTAKSIHCDSVYRKMRVKRSDVWLSILFFLIGFTGSQGANNGSRKAGITIEHSANPPEAAKCTPVTLTCRLVLDDQEAEVDVWWTFRGENATKLPNVTIDSDPSKRVWELHLLCPTVEHDGNYDCNAHSWSETELVYRKEATVKVYVPTSVEVGQNETYEELGAAVNLTCLGYGFPQTSMTWYKNEELLRPEEGRLDVEVTSLNKETLFGLVMIYSLLREDNGTYKCKIENNHGMSAASQDILILEPPEVSVDSVDPLDSRTALLRWHVRYRGNLPVKRFHLQVKNFSTGADWLDVDDKIPPNATTYTVRYLAPAMTYGFQLAAVNDAGPSEWEIMNVTMPADVPPKVSWVHLLASTNETLLFGWRRPNHDNGANITNYEVWLTKNGQLYTNGTLAVSQLGRTNYMYVFVSLEPGEPYSFQVQACSVLGCGNRSDPLDAVTSDGFADPPENVETTCVNASSESPSYVIITWSFPKNSRGTLQGFNVSLDSQTKYRNLNGNIIVENFKEFIDVKGKTLTTKYIIKPNTQYTVRVCSVNKAGCGLQSTVTNKTTCASAPSVPTSVPQLQLQRLKKEKDCKQLKLELSRVSERNGFIWCYRIIIVKLRKGDTLLNLPSDPQNMNISTYAEVHKSDKSSAYVAEAFSSDDFRSEVIIGDNKFSQCNALDTESTTEPSGKQKRTATPVNELIDDSEYAYDGELSHNTNYTGYLEVRVWGSNGTLLSKQSPYFTPIKTGSLPSPVPAESPVAFFFGVVCGVLLVVLVFVLVLYLVRRKSGHPYEEGERLGLTAFIRRTVHRNGHLPRGKGNHLSKLPRMGPVSADELPAAFVERHIDSDLVFQSEFEALPEKHKDRTTNASDSPENLLKNRYPDIKAYDQTRVRLPLIEGVPGSDYINANFVEGYKARKTFICAQGPLERTVFDFWRMIWEHRVCVIVMLTGIEEHGKIKCSQYWCDDEPKIIEETFSVSVVSTKKYSDYIVRRLQVKCIKDEDSKDEREILHFHFMMWKDFLAPEQPSWLLRFVKRVNENYSADRGPLLVHCSAGVGRTGTFVAIDSLLQQLEEEGQVDIYIYICSLRRQRNFLVQSLKQYIFVYRALMEHAQFGDTEIEMHHLRDHYEQLKDRIGDDDRLGLELEFEKLGEVIEDPKTSCVGTMAMNMSKNRYDFIIPYDINRVILPPSPSRDHSSYINASFIQGYDRSLSFIMTQDPLANTVTEFWRMIMEQSVATVVMLSDMGEGQTKCQQYWPDVNDEKEFDYVRVKAISSEESSHYIRREFVVGNIKTEDSHKVVHFQFLGWTNPVPEHVTAFLSLIEAAQHCQEQNATAGPLTVHCSGGGDRSSVFVTLTVLIQQLKAEERVDVFQAARYTRSQRCCMLQTLAQYDFLYRGLLEYIISHKLCDLGDTQL